MTDVQDIRNDLEAIAATISSMQSKCVHCVTFKPGKGGKVEVEATDKETLEALNMGIDRLKQLSAKNDAVLSRLTELLGNGTIADAKAREQGLRDQITKANNLFRFDLSALLEDNRRNYDVDPSDPFKSPKAQALKEKHDATIAQLDPLLQETRAKLAQINTILQDYQPSGIKLERADFAHAITREKVGGMA